jgi:hypothetical protein
MKGMQVKASISLRTMDLAWHLERTPDVNGDGRSDMLWRNDNGAGYIW